MEYVWNNINHSFYTKHDKHNNPLTMLSMTVVDDILFAYMDLIVEIEFYNNLSATFDISTPLHRT